MVKKYRVVWDEDARTYFKEAISYIKKDSPQNAEKVKREVIESTRSLANEPQRLHAPDKDRLNNDGSYRAYEIQKFRISYFVSHNEIRVVRIRHTKQDPRLY